ncbi:hypothetical protein DRO55_03400 [Candidatus Bathyarchaeota archaeon]|nr:MAG: hypothetical protein DRO55_03400 [Candidatus Bathyarchaeota archaeon]
MATYILLPCYNEERNLGRLIYEISQACVNLDYTVIAVDDGSSDNTYNLLKSLSKEYPIVLLRHEKNKGLHEALRTLLFWTYKNTNENDLLITMDSDLTHDPAHIPTLVAQCREKGMDVAIASRYVKGGKQLGVPFYRVLLSKALQALTRATLKIPVKDVSSGYRCIRSYSIKKAIEKYGSRHFIETKGFDVQLEILYKLFLNGAKITEIPITLDYSKKKSKSKLKVTRTILRYIKTIKTLKALYYDTKSHSS